MRWVLMLFVILAAVMGGEARAVVVMGRAVVSERVGKAEAGEMEALRVESDRASRGAFLEVEEVAGLEDAGPLALWFRGGLAVARSDCGDRQAEFSGRTLSLLLARGVDIGGGTRGLLWTARRETGGAETGSAVTLRFNRYNSRGDVVGQSDAAGVTTWAATYQADGRRTGEVGTNLNPKQATGRVRELGVNRDRHRANCLPKATQNAASGLAFHAAFAAGRSKEEDPTGLLNEGFRYRDMETGTFISRDPLGHVDGPNVYCYVGQNPWTAFDPEGLELMVAGEGAIHHNGTQYSGTPSFFDAIFRGDAVLDRRDRSEWKRAQRIADPRHRRPDLPSDEQIRQTRERVDSDVEPSAKMTASYATAAEREAGIAYAKEEVQAPRQDENLMRLHNRSAAPGATSDLAAQIGSDTNRDIALQWMGERLCRGLTNYARTAQAAESGVRATANFAQTSFREGFSKAGSAELSKIAGAPIRTIDDLAGALRLGAIKPGQIPVNIINRGSNQLILNTRTAQALERAGIPRSQWNAVNQSGNAQFEAMLDAQLGRNQLGPSGTMLTFPE